MLCTVLQTLLQPNTIMSLNTSLEQSVDVENKKAYGIDPKSEFGKSIPVHDHAIQTDFEDLFETVDNNAKNNVDMGNIEQKAEAAYEVLRKSQAVLVRVEPWYIHETMGKTTDDKYDRWEPFFIAFPEITEGSQMNFTNLAPLSEITYRIKERNRLLNKTSKSVKDIKESDSEPPWQQHVVGAQTEELKAFTRYKIPCSYNGEEIDDETYEIVSDDANGAWLDKSIVKSIHIVSNPYDKHFIVGRGQDGSLYCDRGALFEDDIDVAIGIPREEEYNLHKVPIFNDKSSKDALNQLEWEETHMRYLGHKKRWQADLKALDTIITELLSHESIQHISVHRVTEKAFVTHYKPSFTNKIDYYPAFN